MPRVGLIVNDGKELALATAETIEARLQEAVNGGGCRPGHRSAATGPGLPVEAFRVACGPPSRSVSCLTM